MTEVQVDIELEETTAMRYLDTAINQFTHAHAMSSSVDDDDLPVIMVKTRSRPSGKLVKSLFFRDAEDKKIFLKIFNQATLFNVADTSDSSINKNWSRDITVGAGFETA